MTNLLSSTDNKLQKCALECLTKSGYCRGILTKYKKMLDGFADDEKFKDMIPIMSYGSNTGPGTGESVPEEYTKDSQDKQAKKAKRKETKQAIPKLEEEDRASVLPIVIKLLQSKLQQQKGAINKKSIFSRRSLVFQFYATFDKETEFPLIVDELLQGVGLTVKNCMDDSLLDKLSGVNFNDFVTFIKQLDAMLKQMGTLMMGLLPSLANVLVNGLIKLSKLFIKQINYIKIQNGEDEPEIEESDGDESGSDAAGEGEVVHRNAGRQAKDCLRKALSLVKDIFRKFSYGKEFISGFSEMVFREIMSDQLALLKTKYVCDKSQMLEIICVAWTEHHHTLENLIRYKDVLPAAIDMLSHPSVSVDVASLLIGLIKSLIFNTMEEQEKGKGVQAVDQRRKALKSQQRAEQEENNISNDEEDQEMQDEQAIAEAHEITLAISQEIISKNINYFANSIHSYW